MQRKALIIVTFILYIKYSYIYIEYSCSYFLFVFKAMGNPTFFNYLLNTCSYK